MRLLQSHCNREWATKQLGSLLRRARKERVERPAVTTPRKGPRRLSAEVNAAIMADYLSGMKATAVARKHGINEWTVRHLLRRSGIPLRPGWMIDEEIELTFVLRAQGLSYERIAERIGFSEGTVRNVLKRHSASSPHGGRKYEHAARAAHMCDAVRNVLVNCLPSVRDPC